VPDGAGKYIIRLAITNFDEYDIAGWFENWAAGTIALNQFENAIRLAGNFDTSKATVSQG
ncbi:MAG: hypothetical protein FWH22_07510, partial [Fibromonadales bacterium]|nr:hypothetical protein [Fibromonadales bacterium]